MRVLVAQFTDITILVLIGAAVVSGAIGELADTLVILVVVLLNAALGAFQELRAERAMAALKKMAAPSCTVLRDGAPQRIPAADLVPGDAVALEAGDIVPADMRMFEVAGLRVNESALTGESVPVDKTMTRLAGDIPPADRINMAFKGTTVTTGRGLGMVVATGMRTELGRIAQLLGEHQQVKTPLQRRLGALGRQIGLIVVAICILVFVVGILRGEPTMPVFLTALSLAVAAIPEALPAVVSIALALGARRMAVGRALVRHLPAVETLGAVTFICSDKTGTLTANQMRVDAYYCDGTAVHAFGSGETWRRLRQAMALSHDAYFDSAGTAHGDPTEIALLVAARDNGLAKEAAERETPRVAELPFEMERKRMSTVHRCPDGTYLSITKGAAEVLVDLSRTIRQDATTGPIDRGAVLAAAERMAGEGLRVLAFATRRWEALPDVTPEVLESDLEFLALVAMLDPPRSEARDSVATCMQAGIVPVMITGDHPATARAIARRIGLLDEDGELLSGAQLAALGEHELAQRVRDVRAYARVVPEQKVRIVEALQKNGEIVAMTGDGVNDAPALAQADVGIAIGAGTDVAVATADVVLVRSNPLDVVSIIKLSRATYRKMVQNLAWATGYNVFAIPLAAGVLYPSFGILLRPEWAALLMSASSIIVVFNALLLRGEKL